MSGTEQLGSRRRVAKNTLFLYMRTAVSLILNLYASRLVLKTLGVSDFGLFSVVASIIASFSFITMSMNGAISRFLCAELGKADEAGVAAVFKASCALMLAVAIFIFGATQCVGSWYIANHLVIPAERLSAADTTFNLSLASASILILAMPFQAMLVATENIKTFASITLLGDILKFCAVVLLAFLPWDKLPAYACLLACVSLTTAALSVASCLKNYSVCRGPWHLNWSRLKEIGQYACWDTLGCLTIVAQQQGLNLLINSFFGLIYNAAYGIANQVIGSVSQFVWNFLTAINPQIMKLYHAGRHEEMVRMMSLGSYLAAFLLMFFAVPLFIEVDFVLSIWLGDYPPYAPAFIRIFLIQSVITAISRSIVTAVHSIGLVKIHNLSSCSIVILILPISYVLLSLNVPLNTVLLINIIPWVLECVVDSFIIRSALNFSVRKFFFHTYLRILAYGLVLLTVPYSITLAIPQDSFIRFIIVGTCSVVTFCVISFFFVMDNNGRKKIINLALEKINQLRHM